MSYAKLQSSMTSNKKHDECYTPAKIMSALVPFLDPSKTYYEATSGISSNILYGLSQHDISIKGSDKDFFSCTKDDVFDGIITNPPYSIKDKFIEHCYSLNVPFALLMPVQTLQGIARGKLFKENGISVLIYSKRIDFTNAGSPPFGVAWFMHGLCEPNKIFFAE